MFRIHNKACLTGLFILLLSFFGSVAIVKADYTQCSDCHLFGGKWNFTPSNLSYWDSPSVASYGYGDATSAAVSGWTGHTYPAPTINLAGSEGSAHIKFYIDENVLPSGIGGITSFWQVGTVVTEVSDQIPGTDQTYDLATVVIDHANISGLSYYGPDFRKHLMGHEMGHTLGLNHFSGWPSAHAGSHWMNSCGISVTCVTSPSTTDVQHLQAKFWEYYP